MLHSLVLLSAAIGTDAPQVQAEKFFTSTIRPLLSAKCWECHSGERVEGDLRLDSRAGLLKGGERGPAINLKDPEKSLLIVAIHRSDGDLQMPPNGKLSASEVEHFKTWIKNGAPWPEPLTAASSMTRDGASERRIGDAWSDKQNPIVKLFHGKRLDLWSFKSIDKRPPPFASLSAEQRNPIDLFNAERRIRTGHHAVPAADRRTLLRRLSFDLVGLPPTPEEVQNFVEDFSPIAYERVVDRLLASPGFGEHWGRKWLDVVRYSDSNGFDWDEFRPEAWRYRDYVVRSFNDDKPFDRFVIEQLAGDELATRPPKDRDAQDALIATGYLRLGPQDNSAPLFNEQTRARTELLSDLVETTGAAFLGLSFSCCRCHDHKHDPLSQADYYRFRAFFEGVKYGDGVSIDLMDEQKQKQIRNDEIDKQISGAQTKIERLTAKNSEEIRRQKTEKLSPVDRARLEALRSKNSKKEPKELKKLSEKIEPTRDEIHKSLSERDRAAVASLESQVANLKAAKTPQSLGLLMIEGDGAPPPTHLLGQGDHRFPKKVVSPGFPSAFDPNDALIERCENQKSTGRRYTLAKWIVSAKNPLTARVFVNRAWQGLFGRGLVDTPDDFGTAGGVCSDARLLDWLAKDFVDHGWSVKHLVRTIVCSAAYQEKSLSLNDTPDAFVGGRRIRRLSAEQLRDAMLAVSGLQHWKHGGPPSWPDLPTDVLQANPAFLDDNATKTKGWYPSPMDEQFCRSLYLVQKRTLRVPFMEAFDLPENMTTCGRRNVSIVAPQALSLLNSPLTKAVCDSFASRIERQVGDDPRHQVECCFQLAFQRAPSDLERKECRRFLLGRRLTELCRAVVNGNEFIYLD